MEEQQNNEEVTITQPESIKTEVTSIAKEEEKTGQKVPLPNPEDLVTRASVSLISCKRALSQIFPKLSLRGKTRVMLAILDLPTNDVPVELRGHEEIMAFSYGQKMIQDRFLITQYHISKEIQRRKEELDKKEVKAEDLQFVTSEELNKGDNTNGN
jgi:hypothetical protein